MAKAVKTPFNEVEIKQIEAMAGCGLKVPQIAHCLSISKKTFERRLKYSPGSVDALEKGRALAEANVSKSAYEMAISKKVPSMTMFWLKCRAGWRENQDLLQVTGGGSILIHQIENGKPVGQTILKTKDSE